MIGDNYYLQVTIFVILTNPPPTLIAFDKVWETISTHDRYDVSLVFCDSKSPISLSFFLFLFLFLSPALIRTQHWPCHRQGAHVLGCNWQLRRRRHRRANQSLLWQLTSDFLMSQNLCALGLLVLLSNKPPTNPLLDVSACWLTLPTRLHSPLTAGRGFGKVPRRNPF